MTDITHTDIKNAITRSQHCQRNWDLTTAIPEEDLTLLIEAATQCPSKQNVAYYRTHFITSRGLIDAIYEQTDGFTLSGNLQQQYGGTTTTNTQVLANLLVVLEEYNADEKLFRNDYTNGSKLENVDTIIQKNCNLAAGIATGYLNLTANLLGYRTGNCTCFSRPEVKKILNLENNPILLIGIGYSDDILDRRTKHDDHTFLYPTFSKQQIPVIMHK
jgi:nitroreductase